MQLVIRNASIAGISGTRDIGIDAGRITSVEPRVEGQADRSRLTLLAILCQPGSSTPTPTWTKPSSSTATTGPQREMQATPRMTSVVESDKVKRNFTVDDVRQRAVRLARMCAAHGTTTLRSHVDIDEVVGLTDMEGVLAAKEELRGLIDIQVSPYAINGFEGQPQSEPLLREALRMGADLVGGVPEADEDGNAHVDKVFALANEFGLGIDFHTDQVRASRPFALPHIAEKTIADGMQGMVMGSHCFALGHVPEDEHKQAIDLCAQAGVSICVTPYFSMRERVVPATTGWGQRELHVRQYPGYLAAPRQRRHDAVGRLHRPSHARSTPTKRWTQFWRWAPSALPSHSGSPTTSVSPSANAPTSWCWKPPPPTTRS